MLLVGCSLTGPWPPMKRPDQIKMILKAKLFYIVVHSANGYL